MLIEPFDCSVRRIDIVVVFKDAMSFTGIIVHCDRLAGISKHSDDLFRPFSGHPYVVVALQNEKGASPYLDT